MSLESSDKELTTALERVSITNEVTPINNENNVTILTQNVFDATDSIRLNKKHPDLESISIHIKKTRVLEFDKNSIEKAISELVKLNLIVNKKTPQGLDSFYQTSRNEILICEMENLLTKENTSNSLTIREEINYNADGNFFSELINSQTPPNGAQNINETCPPMNQTLATPHPDNILTNDINNFTLRNNVLKYDSKILALRNYVQCELSTLHNKIDRFMETFNKTISNFKTKSLEILRDSTEFFQNELRSKDEIIKTLMGTQTAVFENLLLNKPSQQTENNTSFHASPQKDVNQLNKNILFKRQANQE